MSPSRSVFVLLVLVPVAISGWYLWTRAADQYASHMGFSVRSESGASSSELLGGLTSLVGMSDSSSSDTDILYKFIQSRDLVERVDNRLNLREIWSKPENDPVFSYTAATPRWKIFWTNGNARSASITMTA
ncbi:hypothetical protein [Paracoccus homiensis]|uniref:hypothetical protein n=1 Tax=Paracoccus homiensis TaxID=364199 RepID=UPI00398D62A4